MTPWRGRPIRRFGARSWRCTWPPPGPCNTRGAVSQRQHPLQTDRCATTPSMDCSCAWRATPSSSHERRSAPIRRLLCGAHPSSFHTHFAHGSPDGSNGGPGCATPRGRGGPGGHAEQPLRQLPGNRGAAGILTGHRRRGPGCRPSELIFPHRFSADRPPLLPSLRTAA